jgi:hypothetical protein
MVSPFARSAAIRSLAFVALALTAPSIPLAGQSSPTTLTRGPYLQLGTPTSIVVRWQTSVPVVGSV